MMWSTRMPPESRSTRAHHVAEGRVAELGEPVGPPRRLAPVLAELVELVRAAPHGDPAGEGVPQAPRVGAVRVHAHGEVVDDAEGHPRGRRLLLDRGELLLEQPLQPRVEVDVVGVPLAERRDRRAEGPAARRATPVHGRPCTSASAHHVANVVQPLALPLAEVPEGALAPARRARRRRRGAGPPSSRSTRRPGRCGPAPLSARAPAARDAPSGAPRGRGARPRARPRPAGRAG